MNKPVKFPKTGQSLLERANEAYDFGSMLRGPSAPPVIPPATPPAAPVQVAEPVTAAPTSRPTPAPSTFTPSAVSKAPAVIIDRDLLRLQSMIVPDGAVSGISEEFRIVKRQLLIAAMGNKQSPRIDKGERILICSAHPNEGKTFCALNLALSIAAEKDNDVLLVDADFAKPSVLKMLGISQDGRPGLMDALSDPAIRIEDCVLDTDVPGLSLLPSGKQTNNDTEYLASRRTQDVLDRLTADSPNRIVIFDSPPALAASPASELAMHVGQVVLIVRADVTNDTSLRDALSLLSGCDNIQLLLNSVKFSPTGRSFGSYYGYGG